MNNKEIFYMVTIILISLTAIAISYNIGYAHGWVDGGETYTEYYENKDPVTQCSQLGICVGDKVELSSEAKRVLSNDTKSLYERNAAVKVLYDDGVVMTYIDDYGHDQINELWLVSVPDVIDASSYDTLHWATVN